jgi:hypothetical protein
MSFTVMRDNVSALPEIAALAQTLGVRLYLNLATDKTFLFRDPAVSAQARVPADDLAVALEKFEQVAREDARWLPRYSDLRYIPRHFDDIVQRGLPCAESQLKLMIHASCRLPRLSTGLAIAANMPASSARNASDAAATTA